MRVTVELIATCTPSVPMAALMLEGQVRGSLHHAFESPCETSAVARHDLEAGWIVTARILADITDVDFLRASELPDADIDDDTAHVDVAMELATHALQTSLGITCEVDEATAFEADE